MVGRLRADVSNVYLTESVVPSGSDACSPRLRGRTRFYRVARYAHASVHKAYTVHTTSRHAERRSLSGTKRILRATVTRELLRFREYVEKAGTCNIYLARRRRPKPFFFFW